LPTAAGSEGNERLGYWNDLGLAHFQQLGAASVRTLPVIDRATANDLGLAEAVSTANFVYLSGGSPAYLYDTLTGTPVWQAIESVLAAGGVVAGCSAGAMIFGDRIPRNRNSFSLQDSFGYLPGTVVLPHFDEMPGFFRSIIPLLVQHHLLVGVEGYTALICQNSGFQVRGRGCVTLAVKNQQMRYCEGETLPV
jgi:cyanophycinase